MRMAIDTGTIVLDRFDTASERLVWTGRAKRFIDPKDTEQERKRAKEAIEARLAHFPPI